MVKYSASPLLMFTQGLWHMGAPGYWMYFMVGKVMMLLTVAFTVVMYLYRDSTNSHTINSNRYLCCLG